MTTGSATAAPLEPAATAPKTAAITPANGLDATIARRAKIRAPIMPIAQRSSDRAVTYDAPAPVNGCRANAAEAKNAAHAGSWVAGSWVAGPWSLGPLVLGLLVLDPRSPSARVHSP